MEPISFVYLAVYFGFNILFGVVFIIGVRCLIKMINLKKRKKYFTDKGEVRYLHREVIKEKLGGTQYRYTYAIKVNGAEGEGTIDSIVNAKLNLYYPTDGNWYDAMVNPENHSEFRLRNEDEAIDYYRVSAIIVLGYGLLCRLIFEFAIWGAFLAEGGLR